MPLVGECCDGEESERCVRARLKSERLRARASRSDRARRLVSASESEVRPSAYTTESSSEVLPRTARPAPRRFIASESSRGRYECNLL